MSKRPRLILAAALIFASTPALADPVSDFYTGKQIRFIIRTTVGGDYDQYSRLFARFMGKHIPGNPSMIPINMPGGGGITAANYMANIAPRDGTVIGIVSQGLAVDQALGMSPQLKADLREFNWIANVAHSNQLLVVWHTSLIQTIEDAKKRETTIGTTGAGSASVQYPAFYNNVIGTKFKIVFGYPGGQMIDLAMERGEVEGRGTNPYSGWMASEPTWIPQKLIIPLVQAGLEKDPALPDVPLITDLLGQASPATRRCWNSWGGPRRSDGRSRPRQACRPSAHRRRCSDALAATLKDPEFIAAAAHEQLDIQPMSGDRLREVIVGILNSPADTRARVKIALQPKDEHTTERKATPP